MPRKPDGPGEWSAIEWPLVCSQYEGGRPCYGRPVPGDHRCPQHYGKIDGQAARKRRKLVEKYVGKGPVDLMKGISREQENALFKHGPQEKDPGVLLLEEVHRTAGIVLSLEDKLKELDAEDLVWSLREQTEESGYKGDDSINMVTKRYGRAVNEWYQLYAAERKHLAAVAAAAIKAGVEERRVRIAERGIDTLEAALVNAFRDLGLDPSSQRVREVIGQRLAEALGGDNDLFGTNEGARALEAVPVYAEAEIIDDSTWGKTGPEESF